LVDTLTSGELNPQSPSELFLATAAGTSPAFDKQKMQE
jgi:hypothetical protein